MCQLSIITAIRFLFVVTYIQSADEQSVDGSNNLVDVISKLNREMAKDAIGKDQPPLTEDDVVAAIRSWKREKDSPVSEQLCIAVLRTIV